MVQKLGVVVNDSSDAAVAKNLRILNSAIGICELPRGTVYIDEAIIHTYINTNLTLIGNNTTIENISGDGNALLIYGDDIAHGSPIDNFSYAEAVSTNLSANQVGFQFNYDIGSFTRVENRRYTGTAPAVGDDPYTHVKRLYIGCTITDAVQGQLAITVATPSLFTVGDTVIITDGAWVTEISADFRKVVSISGSVVNLDLGLSRDFSTAAIGKITIPDNITYQGINFVAQEGPFFAKAATNITFKECRFPRGPNYGPNNTDNFVTPVACEFVNFINCKIDQGLHLGTACNVTIRDCSLSYLTAEEGSHHIYIDNCNFGKDQMDSSVNCHSWEIKNSRFWGSNSINLYDHYNFINNTVYGSGIVLVRGYKVNIDWLRTPGTVSINHSFEGAPATAAQLVNISNSRMAVLNWADAGSTATLSNNRIGSTTGTPNPG